MLGILTFGVPIGWLAAWFVRSGQGSWRSLLFTLVLIASALAVTPLAGIQPAIGLPAVVSGAGLGVVGHWILVTYLQGRSTGWRSNDPGQ